MQMKHRKTSERDSTAAESAKCAAEFDVMSSLADDVDTDVGPTTPEPWRMPSKTSWQKLTKLQRFK